MRKMTKLFISAIIIIAALSLNAQSQEVIITDFPLGVGSDIKADFFEPYFSQLRSLADTLEQYPYSIAIITGGADGIRYRRNHNAQNPGLAIGRAQALRNLLVSEFGIDPGRIVIQANYADDKGGPFRYAAVRVTRELSDLEKRIDLLEKRPPVENRVTEVKEIYKSISDNMGLQVGLGLSSSPFGGVPIATGAITWKRFIYLEGIVGHTIWNNSFTIQNDDLSTRRRLAGGLATVYPLPKVPVGVVGGWIRVEEIASRYNSYVRMSEGPVIGLRISPHEFVSITAVQNTAKQNTIGDLKSRLKNGQFIIFADIHFLFGGGK